MRGPRAAPPTRPLAGSPAAPPRSRFLPLRPAAGGGTTVAYPPPPSPRPESPVASAAGSLDAADEGGSCPSFIDRDGDFVEAACCDFGFRTGKGRMYSDDYGTIPKSALELGIENFQNEYSALRRSFRENEYGRIAALNPPKGPVGWAAYKVGEGVVRSFAAIDKWLEDRRIFSRILPLPVPPDVFDARTGGLSKQCLELRAKLARLTLSNDAVWERERELERAGGGVETPLVVKIAYYALCYFLDFAFDNRPIQRFWFLETVARMPYFSYVSVLHLYESLGWWRAGVELRKVHAAQEIGEMHHLQITESMGGDALWSDRFLAQHSAVLYYVVLLVMYLVSPKLAYNFSELIETHAVVTYTQFLAENEGLLKELPAPYCAVKYYRSNDLFYFDEFQTRRRAEFSAELLSGSADDEAEEDLAAGIPEVKGAADCSRRLPTRRPIIRNLYDVFAAIAEDEGEHVATMTACIDGTVATQLRAKEEEREAVSQALLDMQRERREAEAEAKGGGGSGPA